MPYATPEAAIRARLVGDSAVNVIVAGRVSAQLNTQEPTLPLIVFRRVSGSAPSTLGGPGRLGRYVFQVDVYAETESAAATLAAAVDAALLPADGWRDVASGVHGAFPDDTTAAVTGDPYRVWSRVIGLWFQGA